MPTYNVARGSFMNAVVSAIRIASGRACQRATAFMQIYVQLLEGRKMIANKVLIDFMYLCSMEQAALGSHADAIEFPSQANGLDSLGSIVIGARSAVESKAWITSISDRLGRRFRASV
jgi:hypothetical protein